MVEFLDETFERPAPPVRVSKPATLGHGLEGEAGRGAQVAEGRNRSRHLAHIEMGAAAVPPGTREPTELRRQLQLLELACALGIPGDIRSKAEDLLAFFGAGNIDEVDVLGKVWERMAVGRQRYGLWDSVRDARDLSRERDEEVFDGLVYAGQKAVRGG